MKEITAYQSDDGKFVGTYDEVLEYEKETEIQTKNERVVSSIKYYHLDHPDLNEARRQLALDIRDWIETGDELYPDLNTGKGSIDKAFETNLDNIARAIAFDAPFSVFAKKIVKGYQDREWIEDLLECV